MTVRRLNPRGRPLHTQTFDAAGTGGWSTGANASALTRDTTRDAGPPGLGTSSLRWTATAAGDTGIVGPFYAVPASVDVLIVAKLYLAAGPLVVRMAGDWYDAGGNYLAGFYDYSRSLTAGRWGILALGLSMPANAQSVQPSITAFSAASGQQLWMDNLQVFS